MNLRTTLLAVAFLTVPDAAIQATSIGSKPAGQQLAAELRNLPPVENSQATGVLKISVDGKRVASSFRSQVFVEGKQWTTIYTSLGPSSSVSSQMAVVHSIDSPNQYRCGSKQTGETNLPNHLSAEVSFAGSDFSLADLGLEFLHWPEQTLLADDSKLRRDCFVLESRNSQNNGIVRVKSWIDKESKGILAAEAYDAKENKVKEFTLSGSSFRKIKGRWYMEKMTIRSRKKKSETVMQFDLPKN